MAGVFINRSQSRPIRGGYGGGDVYFNPGSTSLDQVGVIQPGRRTQYVPIQRGFGNANDLIDMAISRKQQLFNQYNDLANQLNYVDPRSAEARSIHAQLGGIRAGVRDYNVDRAFQMRDAQNAINNAHRDAITNQHEAELQDSAGAMQRLIHADQLFRNGQISQDEHDQVLLGIPQQFPNATHAQPFLNFLAQRNDKMRDYQSRLNDRDTIMLSRKYGVPIQTDESGTPDYQATMNAAMQSPRGQSEQLGVLNQNLARQFGIHSGVSSLFNPVQPHVGGEVDKEGNFVQSDNQTHIRLPFLNQKGQTQYSYVPTDTFNAAKQALEPDYRAIVGEPEQAATAAPQTTQQPQFQAGKVYQDANGNKATYNQDGTWTPQ